MWKLNVQVFGIQIQQLSGKLIFPSDRKKRKIVPVHKKIDTQHLSNYRPISLLPTCS